MTAFVYSLEVRLVLQLLHRGEDAEPLDETEETRRLRLLRVDTACSAGGKLLSSGGGGQGAGGRGAGGWAADTQHTPNQVILLAVLIDVVQCKFSHAFHLYIHSQSHTHARNGKLGNAPLAKGTRGQSSLTQGTTQSGDTVNSTMCVRSGANINTDRLSWQVSQRTQS